MLMDQAGFGNLGFGLKKIGRGLKKVGKVAVKPVTVTAKAGKAVGKGVAKGGKAVGKGAVKGVKAVGKGVKAISKASFRLITKPLRSRVDKLTNRRAAKIAWDRRQSKQPNAQEKAEARQWAKNEFRKKGPHGKLIAALAGCPTAQRELGSIELGVDPATMTAVAGVIGALTAMAQVMLTSTAKSGEAPVDPTTAPPTAIEPTEIEPEAAVDEEMPQEQEQVEAEEGASDAEDQMLEGAGLLAASPEALKATAAPAAMSPKVATKAAKGANKVLHRTALRDIAGIGGPTAVRVAQVWRMAVRRKDFRTMRSTLPAATAVAAKVTAAKQNTARVKLHTPGGLAGHVPGVIDVLTGVSAETATLLGCLSETDDPQGLIVGMANADLGAIVGDYTKWAMLPMGAAVAAGFWMLLAKD